MAHLLGAEALHLEFPTKVVFDGVSLGIDEGDRIGIVGRNGDGKSSLLAMLAGRLEPGRRARDGPRRRARRRARPGRHARRRPHRRRTRSSATRPSTSGRATPRIRDVIAGLLGDIPWDAPIGEPLAAASAAASRSRRCSSGDDDVLFLDEPTNHLDVEAIAWLAEHLQAALVADAGGAARRDARPVVPRRGLHRRPGRCTTASSSPSRAATRRTSCSASSATGSPRSIEARRQNLARKELAWLRRGAPARTSKPKFRIDAANELIADVPEIRDSVALQSLAVARLGKDVVDLLDASRLVRRPTQVLQRRRVAHRAGRAHRHPRASTARASRRCSGWSSGDVAPTVGTGQARQDRQGRDPHPAARRARGRTSTTRCAS